jgi:bifunctional DNase/RNase
MKKVELKIIGLSYSQSQAGSYVLVLGEKKGKLKLPIIIKPQDAQFIAMKIDGLSTPRPLIHELFKKLTDFLNADLQQVYISHILEGIFYAKLIFSNVVDDFEIDCSVGDAICLALQYGAPIFCTKEVIKLSGIEIDDDGSVSEEQSEANHKERDYSAVVTVENLERMLQKALENEEYEIASQLRDRIQEIKSNEE